MTVTIEALRQQIKDEIDKLREKEDDLQFKIDEAIDELEDPSED